MSLSGYLFEDTLVSPTLGRAADMTFQRSANRVVTKTFGFREAMIRLHNQLMYSMFDECGPFVLKGKDDYLFEGTYIPAVCGENYLGVDRLNHVADSLQFLDQLLNDHGKKFLFIIAPNKLRYHQNKLDLECDGVFTNYSEMRQLIHERGIEMVDFISEFQGLDHKYPLFSKSGSHWSLYGASLAAQRIQEKLDDLGVSEGMLVMTELKVDEYPRKTDKDLHGLLNIVTRPGKEELAYPRLVFEGKRQAKALIVGDSYYTMFVYLGIVNEMFAPDSKMLYYNKSVMTTDVNNRGELTEQMRMNALNDAEVVILLSNEDAFTTLGWGFMNDAIQALHE
ncbi:MAG: hypothetical protein R2813_09115 [Flavobacteriales bacterium]